MLFRLLILCLTIFFTALLFSISKSEMKMKDGQLPVKLKMNDRDLSSKTPYSGVTGAHFDKSPIGYGWYLGYNRKISLNSDLATGSMLGSIYRKNDSTGTGSIGGMTGNWTGTDLNSNVQMIFDISFNWDERYPGGRFPFSCGFINGYNFIPVRQLQLKFH